jgi:hypothetical protein
MGDDPKSLDISNSGVHEVSNPKMKVHEASNKGMK